MRCSVSWKYVYTFTVKSKLSGIINDRTCVRDVQFLENICTHLLLNQNYLVL